MASGTGFGFEIKGVDALKRAFAALSKDLADDASRIAEQHVRAAEGEIRPAYASHAVTGHLARGLRVTTQNVGRFARAAMIRAGAPHSYLYERGTGVRRTRKGWNRGAARSHPTFPEPVARERAQFDSELEDLLRQAGLDVRRG